MKRNVSRETFLFYIKVGHKIMFHVKHFDPRYCDQNRETSQITIVKHRKTKQFFQNRPQYLVLSHYHRIGDKQIKQKITENKIIDVTEKNKEKNK